MPTGYALNFLRVLKDQLNLAHTQHVPERSLSLRRGSQQIYRFSEDGPDRADRITKAGQRLAVIPMIRSLRSITDYLDQPETLP
jgi:hypothetical protein